MTNSSQRQIRLAYADDHPLVRQGICSYLKEFGCFEIDIQADNGAELIQLLKKAKTLPDICILDISMPVKNGYDTIIEIKSYWPSMKFLILTMYDEEYAIIRMLRNGANGYMLKNCRPDELRKALMSIHLIGCYHSELTISHTHNAINGNVNNLLKLNDKELQFLSYCCSDYHYKQISEKMGVSQRTVEGYRDDLFDKLKIKTRTGLAIYAMNIGIVPFRNR
jgi:two-component system, NarL family, invasion response regulator UvrY